MQSIVFRADAATEIGSGHIMRCLSLAHEFAKNEVSVHFICRSHHSHMADIIQGFGYQVHLLPAPEQAIIQTEPNSWLGCNWQQDASECQHILQDIENVTCLVVDHYALDAKWHQQMRSYCGSLMVIDDLADRDYDCDFLLDQTLGRKASNYQALVPTDCKLLLGQDFMMLRAEFSDHRAKAKQKRQQFIEQGLTSPHVLISMGGFDLDNLSQLAIDALTLSHASIPALKATVVLASKAPNIERIKQQAANLDWLELAVDSKEMAKLMLKSDIAIGASGSTAWERCCLGLPTITLVCADNQTTIANNLTQAGATINLGWFDKTSPELLDNAIQNVLTSTTNYNTLVQHCFASCDGLGSNRVIQEVLGHVH